MNRINVVGLGPGNSEYILPAAIKILRTSEVIIGGERNINSIELNGKESIQIKGNLENIIQYIKENYQKKKISVIASGDPGFYSILGYLKKHFDPNELNIVPGISSIQYMFAKLGFSWEDAHLGSLHGRNVDLIEIMKKHSKAAFLTDNDQSYQYIAKILCENGYENKTLYIGNNLSYDDELIFKDLAFNLVNNNINYNLCVVVIADE